MKTILYATDYSDNSVSALYFAEYLARTLDGRCTALHVFDFVSLASTISLSYNRQVRTRRAKEKTRLRQFCESRLTDKEAAGRWTYLVIEGRQAWEQILQIADEIKSDFIIVGSRGGNPVHELLEGSNTTALIDKARCALVAVPVTAMQAQVNHIVYASAMEEADITAIQWLAPVAARWKASLEVVHIITTREYKGEDQMEWFKDMVLKAVHYKKLSFQLLYSEKRHACLQEYLEESQAGLLVMMEREGKNAWEALWHPDLVKRMQTQSRIPLMRFHKEYLPSPISKGFVFD